MKPIYKTLVAFTMLLATSVSITSCREDAPSASVTSNLGVTNDFSEVVKAINDGTIAKEKAVKALTEAIDKMNTDRAGKLASIISALKDVDTSLEAKLDLIDAAVQAQTLLLADKLEALSEAIKAHMLKQTELSGKIADAIDAFASTLGNRMDGIKSLIHSKAQASWTKLDLLEGLIKSTSTSLGDKLEAIETALTTQSETLTGRLDLVDQALAALSEELAKNGSATTEAIRQVGELAGSVSAIAERVKSGQESSATAVASILKLLGEIKDKIGTTPTPTPDPDPAEGYVDLGLSVYWATCNLGGTKPEEEGGYYNWGEVEVKKYNPLLDDFDSYKWGQVDKNEPEKLWLTKYCTDPAYGLNGFTDGKIKLDPEDDAARVKLGAPWRIPTPAECQELIDNCTWVNDTINKRPCLVGTSKLNKKTITLFGVTYGQGADGYWTNASAYEGDEKDTELARYAISMVLSYPYKNHRVGWAWRDMGCYIRPVRPK